MTGKVAARQIGAIYQADSYTGADASVKINACITALASSGGTCDARSLGGTQSMSQEIDLKGASSGRSVTLLLPNNGTWTWSKTDGTSCGIKQFDSTYLLGSQPGGHWGGLALETANSSTNMDSLYCTDPSTASYIRAEGFTAFNSGAGTLANGVLHVNTTFDESSFRYILGNNATGDVWHIDGPCCGTTFDNIQGYGSSATSSSPAGYPLRINGGRAWSITNSTFNGPGNGKSNIYISNSGPQDVVFQNVYMEKYSQDDYATPMVYIGTSDYGITFEGGMIATGCTTTGCSQYAFENHSAGGIAIKSVGLDYKTENGVNDVAFGRTWLSDGGTIQDYHESSALSPYQFIDHATSNSTYAETPTSTQVQDLAGAVQFTPTSIGWYRLLSTSGQHNVSGAVSISTDYNNQSVALEARFSALYVGTNVLNLTHIGQFGSVGPVDEIEVSGDGAGHSYLDIHVNTVASAAPVTVLFRGQNVAQSAIVSAPVVGAVPGSGAA